MKDVGVKLLSILRDDSVGYPEKLRLVMLSLITQPMNVSWLILYVGPNNIRFQV